MHNLKSPRYKGGKVVNLPSKLGPRSVSLKEAATMSMMLRQSPAQRRTIPQAVSLVQAQGAQGATIGSVHH